MRIGTPRITNHGDRVRWTATVDGPPELPEQLWFEVARSHEGLITDRADPAVIGLLIPAMQRGLPLEIDGPVTDELVHALTHGYQDVYSTVIPQLRMVAIDARTTLTAGPAAAGVATGFSAGVDSFAVLAEHHFASVAPSLRLTHLTFFNVGAMGSGDSGRSAVQAALRLTRPRGRSHRASTRRRRFEPRRLLPQDALRAEPRTAQPGRSRAAAGRDRSVLHGRQLRVPRHRRPPQPQAPHEPIRSRRRCWSTGSSTRSRMATGSVGCRRPCSSRSFPLHGRA